MKLNVLLDENRFIVSPGRLDSPLMFPPLMFGDTLPLELRAWRKANNGDVYAVDISSYEITLLVGPPNVRPDLGFWQVTTTFGTSVAIAARATCQEVVTALGGAFGPVTVTGGNGSYVITVVAPGIWALPTATFQGNTLSGVLVFQITPGTATTPAQYRMEVLEVAPARVIPASWTAGNTTVANSFTQISGRLWELTLDPRVDSGFYSLNVDGAATEFISYKADGYQITEALTAANKPCGIAPNGEGGFLIKFYQDATTCSVSSQQTILPYMVSALGLASSGVRELLQDKQFAPVKLSILLTADGKTETVASSDFVLLMPINQPALIVIDAPEMAGLTFSIDDEQSYMDVYQNGIQIASIQLSLPV